MHLAIASFEKIEVQFSTKKRDRAIPQSSRAPFVSYSTLSGIALPVKQHSVSNAVNDILPSAKLLLVLHFPNFRLFSLSSLHLSPPPPLLPLSLFEYSMALPSKRRLSIHTVISLSSQPHTLPPCYLSSISQLPPRTKRPSSRPCTSLHTQKNASSLLFSPFRTLPFLLCFNSLPLRLPRTFFKLKRDFPPALASLQKKRLASLSCAPLHQ